MPNNIPFIEVEAKTYFELGCEIGRCLKSETAARINGNKERYLKSGVKSYKSMISAAQLYLPATLRLYPKIIEEIQGIANGAEVSFDDLFVSICEGEILAYDILKCTSFSYISNNGDVILGHNEDWMKTYLDNGLYLVKGKINNLKFLSLSYMANLPGTSCGINNYGLGCSENWISGIKFAHGVPRAVRLYAVQTARTLEEARQAVLMERTIAGNIMISSRDGSLLSFEDTGEIITEYTNSNFLVHTNHPINESHRNEKNTKQNSLDRYNKSYEILNGDHSPTEETARRILTDHYGTICSHETDDDTTRGVTIASVIANVTKGTLSVCHGNPCMGNYETYSL